MWYMYLNYVKKFIDMGKIWIFFFEYIVLYIICKEWFIFVWNGNIFLKIYVLIIVNEIVLVIGCCFGIN